MTEPLPPLTDAELARELGYMATDAHLAGNDRAHLLLSIAQARLLEIASLPKDDGIWSYYRHEMWSHGNA